MEEISKRGDRERNKNIDHGRVIVHGEREGKGRKWKEGMKDRKK